MIDLLSKRQRTYQAKVQDLVEFAGFTGVFGDIVSVDADPDGVTVEVVERDDDGKRIESTITEYFEIDITE